ncbi:MAG: GNAT family N-acetyltransferase [Pseudomonadota bacterium]
MLIQAHSPQQLESIREMFEEYSKELDFDLCFQHFSDELAGLPGDYALPHGRLYLAVLDEKPAGCAALRRIDESTCEMKRLYVRRRLRGRGTGRELAMRIIDEARAIGYRRMRLDTVPAMTTAIALYTSLGFREITPYRFNPLEGAVYMEMVLF